VYDAVPGRNRPVRTDTGQRRSTSWYSAPRWFSSASEGQAAALTGRRAHTLRRWSVICEQATRIQSQETTMASIGRQATPAPYASGTWKRRA
jgi:hypothetical protein